ncbi:hypothetical protein PHYBLDRAFT_59546 [Phycomyces blakesleeanus NRRL 1555(-)]|uniref:Uncharacterized protein n=1 Tax=Phycomyces blakesleeanus (strain ATCC 8743b / DSM 1359 / FGSC 10004 / NBRC 33097 / NRRL 1555) TaxID=763407 RepID=A0A162UKR2_PHYB8|nr:hypothetical protein PHYBLDRAFT_59546 [Phycomyces blakesleeanus NRRL 1555(-)]OAD76013.1 hypothetical protein PHYBLDRAFT_59546 [Phycomyces blakesleeanus NRRL 1555(-)]|eukprot:XP_018294053.1 hypothetical protein PHYBLDRAFT_59546 [Phycomyces blakesleeanus NRRL 1555(-)]
MVDKFALRYCTVGDTLDYSNELLVYLYATLLLGHLQYTTPQSSSLLNRRRLCLDLTFCKCFAFLNIKTWLKCLGSGPCTSAQVLRQAHHGLAYCNLAANDNIGSINDSDTKSNTATQLCSATKKPKQQLRNSTYAYFQSLVFLTQFMSE